MHVLLSTKGYNFSLVKPQSHLAGYFPIVYDNDNFSNLKPIGMMKFAK